MKPDRSIFTAGLALAVAALACGPTGSGTLPTISAGVTPAPATTAQPTEEVQPTQPPDEQTFEAACGSGDAKLPDTPPQFADYAATILSTLKAHSSVAAIDQGLQAWGSITDRAGAVDASHDLTGDGAADLVVVAQAPLDQFPDFVTGPPGDVYIFGCPGGEVSLLFGDYSTPDRATPRLMTVADINGNALGEVAYTTRNCGAHTCFVQMHVVEWDTAAQNFKDTFPQDTAAPSGELEIKDVDGDGVSEIIQHVGGIGSAGAGPQRTYDETYAWDGIQYALKTKVATSPPYLIHTINDADYALDKQDFAEAITLYRQVIDDPNPLTFLNADELPALRAYARYRLMLAYILSGDEPSAQAIYGELSSQFATASDDAPGASFAKFARLFWEAYQGTKDVGAGCAPVIALAASDTATFQILNNFGYANRSYTPEDMCPSGG